jgi:hypothetical protein
VVEPVGVETDQGFALARRQMTLVVSVPRSLEGCHPARMPAWRQRLTGQPLSQGFAAGHLARGNGGKSCRSRLAAGLGSGRLKRVQQFICRWARRPCPVLGQLLTGGRFFRAPVGDRETASPTRSHPCAGKRAEEVNDARALSMRQEAQGGGEIRRQEDPLPGLRKATRRAGARSRGGRSSQASAEQEKPLQREDSEEQEQPVPRKKKPRRASPSRPF